MKLTDVLRGYVVPDEDRIKSIWAEADFCLDTNVLLDVYRYTDENRVAFLKLLGALQGRSAEQDRLKQPSEVVSIGDQIEVQLLSINKEKQEISLGMKQVQPNPWDKVSERYPTGTMVEGIVRNLTNYGAFIEIEEGISGLLHVSDMSWVRKVAHPSDVLTKGEKVKCVVLSVDQDRKRIALGLKQMASDPWEGDIPGRYHPGDLKKGKVTKLSNFGVFVELEPGLEGLLHISELPEDKVESPKEVVKVGDEIHVKILWVDAADRKIGLSRRRLDEEGEAAAERAGPRHFARLFIPHRVSVEFARNRLAVIRGHFGPQRIIKSRLDEAAKDIRDKHPKHSLLDELLVLVESAKKLVDDRYGEAEKKQMSLITSDTILAELLTAIGDEVGEPYPEADALKEYKRRKEGMIPPFCKMDDDKDEERRMGDVVIWLELLKQYEGKKRPLIFVTDDMKENWWQKSGGRHDPQPALVQEAYTRTGAEILFYTSERFSEIAPIRLGVKIPKGLAEETKQIREQERELLKRTQEKVPLYVLARDLDMDARDLLEICRQAGIDVKNQLSRLSPEARATIVELVRRGRPG